MQVPRGTAAEVNGRPAPAHPRAVDDLADGRALILAQRPRPHPDHDVGAHVLQRLHAARKILIELRVGPERDVPGHGPDPGLREALHETPVKTAHAPPVPGIDAGEPFVTGDLFDLARGLVRNTYDADVLERPHRFRRPGEGGQGVLVPVVGGCPPVHELDADQLGQGRRHRDDQEPRHDRVPPDEHPAAGPQQVCEAGPPGHDRFVVQVAEDVLPQLVSRLVAPAAVLVESGEHDGLEVAAQLRVDGGKTGRGLLLDDPRRLQDGGPRHVVRELVRQQLVEHDAQRVDVRAAIDGEGIGLHLLR